METQTRKIRERLERDGWHLARHGGKHDIYRRVGSVEIIHLPRHRTVSIGVARQIANIAGWR
ncbi:MAG: type II toxin-antitoxin system HicA family toxin [Chloroflexi bacterium]|nr:type II toxin-antitoxin system HicA family toxin [Chloroflexota bacterium]